MRTNNFFRTLAASLLAVVSVSVFAQPYPTGNYSPSSWITDSVTANNITEYVTVDSRMPYMIVPDANIRKLIDQGVFFPSGFFWRAALSTNAWATTECVLTDTSSVALSADPHSGANYYLDSVIMVEWAATGTYRLWHAEKSNSNVAGLTGCESDMSSLQVVVVGLPTVAFIDPDRILGGCSVAGTSINVDVHITGTDLRRVVYSSTYKGLSGSAAAYYSADTLVGVSNLFTDGTSNPEDVTMSVLSIPAATYGTWEYTITGISDRVSRKSLSRVAGNGATAGTEYPLATTTLKVYSLPTPTTKAIRHITNLNW
jgi:hypothetical protein